ncbi:ankyrin repeat and SOCS box protein 2b [Aplochiton taeniatus]
MTKFSYSEYLSQFRNGGNLRSPAIGRLSSERRRCTDRQLQQNDVTSELTDDVDPVFLTIRRGDAKAVNDLAESTPHSLMRENIDGWTPLHEAAHCGQAECVKALLRAQPGVVDKRTLQEQTALLLAVTREHLSCVRLLLEAGADPDISSKNKETPLYKACELESTVMVALILSCGATVNQRCGRGWTALHEAVSRDNTEVCEMLLRAGASINPANTYSITPLTVAAQLGRGRVLSYLFGKGADVNMQTCDGLTALFEASRNGHREAVSLLLSKNADANKPSDSGMLPLHVAAQNGHHEIVSLLVPVTSRARLRSSWTSPLHLAAERGRHQAAAVLLRTGADVNAPLAPGCSLQYPDRRVTPLYFAVANGHAATAELLLRSGAGLGLDPICPLLVAVRQGSAAIAALLLEYGADVNSNIPAFPTTFPGAVTLCLNALPLLKRLLDNGCHAQACFRCSHGAEPHPGPRTPHRAAVGGGEVNTLLLSDALPPLTCTEPTASIIQFCEWVSSPAVQHEAGPIVDLLLDYVSNVQLCSRLTELLGSREEWLAVKEKLTAPRQLLHLCRLRIRDQVGPQRVGALNSLPLPHRLLSYLGMEPYSTQELHTNSA